MHEENVFELILRSKTFLIPNNFRYLNDVNQNIYSTLITTSQYEVKSNVSENIFQCFIKHWVYMQTPYLNFENISEYDQLSQEFDRMVDIVQMFKKNTPKLYSSFLFDQKDYLEKTIKIRNDTIETKCAKHHEIINILFNNDKIYPQSILLEIRKDLINACLSKSMKFVKLLTQKVIKLNGLLYVLNEERKTAYLIKNIEAQGDIIIPRIINHDSTEFIITEIIENAFKNSKKITSIQFSENSELKIIDKYSFFGSSLESISIPPKVTEIGECAFYLCQKLNKIEFSQNSELKSIKIHAFFKCPLSSFSIPSNVFELNDGWCNGMMKLNNFSISKNNKNFMNFNNDFILGKSNQKSDVFDVLIFSRKNIERSNIPPFIKVLTKKIIHLL